jgi:hypothetical protein
MSLPSPFDQLQNDQGAIGDAYCEALLGTYTPAQLIAAISGGSAVTSVFGRVGAVVALSGDYVVAKVTGAAPLASPTFTGIPAAPTAAGNTNTTQIATTAFVLAQIALEALALKTNNVANGNQSILNLEAGSGIQLTDDGVGGVTIDNTSPGPTLRTNGAPNATQNALNFVVDANPPASILPHYDVGTAHTSFIANPAGFVLQGSGCTVTDNGDGTVTISVP